MLTTCRGDEALVQFADGRWVKGSVSGADPDGDLAVLAVETGDAPAVSWSEKPAELGQVVVALANPRGHGMRATVGTVSSLGRSFRGPRGRRIAGGLEHTAPLGRGSSGGPVVDAEGRVLGVNTHRMQEGFYLAVSSDEEAPQPDRQPRRREDAGQAPPRCVDRAAAGCSSPAGCGRSARGRRAADPGRRGGRCSRQGRDSPGRRDRIGRRRASELDRRSLSCSRR